MTLLLRSSVRAFARCGLVALLIAGSPGAALAGPTCAECEFAYGEDQTVQWGGKKFCGDLCKERYVERANAAAAAKPKPSCSNCQEALGSGVSYQVPGRGTLCSACLKKVHVCTDCQLNLGMVWQEVDGKAYCSTCVKQAVARGGSARSVSSDGAPADQAPAAEAPKPGVGPSPAVASDGDGVPIVMIAAISLGVLVLGAAVVVARQG